MPINTKQIDQVLSRDTFQDWRAKFNELVSEFNGLDISAAAVNAGDITRFGGTIDGLSSEDPPITVSGGSSGRLWLINQGGVGVGAGAAIGIGDYLVGGNPTTISGVSGADPNTGLNDYYQLGIRKAAANAAALFYTSGAGKYASLTLNNTSDSTSSQITNRTAILGSGSFHANTTYITTTRPTYFSVTDVIGSGQKAPVTVNATSATSAGVPLVRGTNILGIVSGDFALANTVGIGSSHDSGQNNRGSLDLYSHLGIRLITKNHTSGITTSDDIQVTSNANFTQINNEFRTNGANLIANSEGIFANNVAGNYTAKVLPLRVKRYATNVATRTIVNSGSYGAMTTDGAGGDNIYSAPAAANTLYIDNETTLSINATPLSNGTVIEFTTNLQGISIVNQVAGNGDWLYLQPQYQVVDIASGIVNRSWRPFHFADTKPALIQSNNLDSTAGGGNRITAYPVRVYVPTSSTYTTHHFSASLESVLLIGNGETHFTSGKIYMYRIQSWLARDTLHTSGIIHDARTIVRESPSYVGQSGVAGLPNP